MKRLESSDISPMVPNAMNDAAKNAIRLTMPISTSELWGWVVLPTGNSAIWGTLAGTARPQNFSAIWGTRPFRDTARLLQLTAPRQAVTIERLR